MMQVWLALLVLLILPVCAGLGGAVTWWLTRREQPEDGTLVKHFVVATAMFLVASTALVRAEWVQDRYDPVRKANKALATLPAHVAMAAGKPAEYVQLEAEFAAAARAQVPIPNILAAARIAHMRLARQYLPWAPGRTTLRYARAVLPALQELRVADPAACVRLAWPLAGGAFDLDGRVSEPVARELQEAMGEILSRADLQHGAAERLRRDDPASQHYDLGELQLTYAGLRTELEQRHGDLVGKLHTPAITELPPGRACAATIDLFSGALRQKPAIARGLLGNMLRT
jgi:hypothetical protein